MTKRDLVDYLDAVADRMVPLLAGRPLSVKRVRPGQAPFMQRNVSKGAPDWVRTVADVVGGLAPRDRTRCSATTGARCCGWPTSAPWSSTCRSSGWGRTEPTGLVLDLDPPEGADFDVVGPRRPAVSGGRSPTPG